MHQTLLALSDRVGSELSMRDLKYYLVDKTGAPNKLHQLKTACSFAPRGPGGPGAAYRYAAHELRQKSVLRPMRAPKTTWMHAKRACRIA